MGKSLVALDTDHIKQYVFGTNKLKEIRGASSLLDYLNRIVMEDWAWKYNAQMIYANGGSGLFLIDTDNADNFGRAIQQAFRHHTGEGASITYVVQNLSGNISSIGKEDIWHILELLRWRLREKKNTPPDVLTLPSHPFMQPCDACGIEYASPDQPGKKINRDPGETNERYCISCQDKRDRDVDVKNWIEYLVQGDRSIRNEYLWVKLIQCLDQKGYDLSRNPDRPSDFNVFSEFKGAKDYLGLIYADANSMGQKIEKCLSMEELHDFAANVDTAIYESVSTAITKHLKIEDHLKQKDGERIFPFDILLLGGDDVMIVVPASVAMDVALTIATEFHTQTAQKHTLSVGVVLAPIKYPFALLYDLVESTLKFAKTAGAKAKAKTTNKETFDETFINFMTVTGSTSNTFRKVYDSLHQRDDEPEGHIGDEEFYATLRPYTHGFLTTLLDLIRSGNKLGLGRTKLHQVRQAVLKMNLTTSAGESRAVLRNWNTKQRQEVLNQVYEFDRLYRVQRGDPQNPESLSFHVPFPWFADGKNSRDKDIYRTSLIDFVELYDFVSREETDQ